MDYKRNGLLNIAFKNQQANANTRASKLVSGKNGLLPPSTGNSGKQEFSNAYNIEMANRAERERLGLPQQF